MTANSHNPEIAIIIPCFNEAVTIGKVVSDFKKAIPKAAIYVFDNASSDETAIRARDAGAEVRRVEAKGKGNVIRRMFADVDADIYVMVDGDDTYDADSAPGLVDELKNRHLDMVVAHRRSSESAAYRTGHRFGNRLLTSCVQLIFGKNLDDMLSGYRVLSRRFVKSFPAHSSGFETETELTIHALELRMPVAEIDTPYRSRPAGSESKLNTYRDGFRILLTITKLLKTEKPLLFFSVGFFICFAASLALAMPLLGTYLETGLVPRIPTAILSASLMTLGVLLLVCGVILDTVTYGRIEAKHLAYLAIPTQSGTNIK